MSNLIIADLASANSVLVELSASETQQVHGGWRGQYSSYYFAQQNSGYTTSGGTITVNQSVFGQIFNGNSSSSSYASGSATGTNVNVYTYVSGSA